jgi:sec-independent protein translocase protein TatA
MFGNLGFGEMMIVMVIVLVLFGAKRIPEVSASFGKGIREFKKNLNEVEQSVTSTVTDSPRSTYVPLPPTAPTATSSESSVEDERREPQRLM